MQISTRLDLPFFLKLDKYLLNELQRHEPGIDSSMTVLNFFLNLSSLNLKKSINKRGSNKDF